MHDLKSTLLENGAFYPKSIECYLYKKKLKFYVFTLQNLLLLHVLNLNK